MSEEQKAEAREAYGTLFEEACRKAPEKDLLVLDEAVSACGHGVIPEEKLLAFLRDKPEELEVVLTGREPSEGLYAAADYITRMEKLRHPFDVGIPARLGIEF
jgi:cob(I)alamin adenosyltransferase